MLLCRFVRHEEAFRLLFLVYPKRHTVFDVKVYSDEELFLCSARLVQSADDPK